MSFNEILIGCDDAEEISEVCELWEELKKRRHDFTVIQLEYAKEHFVSKAGELGRRDGAIMKEHLDFLS